jgi:hypothetical protein
MKATSSLTELDDYLSGFMPDDAAASFEESLFTAAAAGEASDLGLVDRVGQFGRYLRDRVGLAMGSSRALVDRILASGLKVEYTELLPNVPIRGVRIADDTEIVISRLDVDLRGYTDILVHIERPDGTLLKTFRDVEYAPEDGALYAVCEATLARMAQAVHTIARITATRGGKREHVATLETLPP